MAGLISKEYFDATYFAVPDYAGRLTALSANGDWVTTADGWVQHQFEVTNDNNWYKTMLTINGTLINAMTIPNAVPTGIYDYAGQLLPVKAGDDINVQLTYSAGTIVNFNYLYFYPIRGAL